MIPSMYAVHLIILMHLLQYSDTFFLQSLTICISDTLAYRPTYHFSFASNKDEPVNSQRVWRKVLAWITPGA